jgi:hypothetical protein
MSLELGLIAAFAIVGCGGAALAGGLLWLRKKDADRRHEQDLHHA